MLTLVVLVGCGRSGHPRSGSDLAEGALLRMTAQPVGDGRMALVVENVSEQTLLLSRGVEIEALELDGASHENQELTDYGVPATAFFLISECGQSTQGCLTLEPEESLRTIPWTGFYAQPQCSDVDGAPSDYAASSGTYRFVITACSGGHRFESPPFSFSGTPSP
jgi:hypothetical protein